MFFYPEGDHGYDNQKESMRPIFFAHGPDFKKGFKIDKMYNVDVFPLMCHLLDIDPVPPNNGSLVNVQRLLKGF